MDLDHTCPTCGFYAHRPSKPTSCEARRTVCVNPAVLDLSSSVFFEGLSTTIAYQLCKGKKWVEREDEE